MSPIAASMAEKLERAGGAVEQRQAVEQGGRADRADHEVLEAGLQRGGAAQLGGAEHVERDRQQLDADEQRQQALGLGQQDHAGDRAEQQRVVLALAGLARRAVAQRQQHGDDAGDVEQHREAERERVDAERALDDRRAVARLPDPDREADRGAAARRRVSSGTSRGARTRPRSRPTISTSDRAADGREQRRRGPGSRSRAPGRRRAAERHGTCATLLGLARRRASIFATVAALGARGHEVRVDAERHDHQRPPARSRRGRQRVRSRDSTFGPTRLCIARWNSRIM